MKKLIMLLSAALMTVSFGFAMADDAAQQPAQDNSAKADHGKAKKHHKKKKKDEAKKDDAGNQGNQGK